MGGTAPRQHSADLCRGMAPCGPLYSACIGPQSAASDIGGTSLSLDCSEMKSDNNRKIESPPSQLVDVHGCDQASAGKNRHRLVETNIAFAARRAGNGN